MFDPDAPRFVDRDTEAQIADLRTEIARLDAIDNDTNLPQITALQARAEARRLREVVDRLRIVNVNPFINSNN